MSTIGGANRRAFQLSAGVLAAVVIVLFTLWHANLTDGSSLGLQQVFKGSKGTKHLPVVAHTTEVHRRRPSWGALRSQGRKASIRGNLKPDEHYLLGFYSPAAGLSNQIIMMINQLSMARNTNRIPILGAFVPSGHEAAGSPPLKASELFDLSQYAAYSNKPVVEVWELKGPETEQEIYWDSELSASFAGSRAVSEAMVEEDLGCYTAEPPKAYAIFASAWWGLSAALKIYWTPFPTPIWLAPTYQGYEASEVHNWFQPNPLPQYTMSPTTAEEIWTNYTELPRPTDRTITEHLPENQIACLDNLFYARSDSRQRWLEEDVILDKGPWGEVGKHLMWNPELKALGQEYLRYAFDLRDDAPIPPFAAMHIRRGDFAAYGRPTISIRTNAWAVSQAIKKVMTYSDMTPDNIIVFTDEKDPDWYAGLKEYGFKTINHTAMNTAERFGLWHPSLLDSVMMSEATVFIGNKLSTMSQLAYGRVRAWQRGVAVLLSDDTGRAEGTQSDSGAVIGYTHHGGIPEDWEWPWTVV